MIGSYWSLEQQAKINGGAGWCVGDTHKTLLRLWRFTTKFNNFTDGIFCQYLH